MKYKADKFTVDGKVFFAVVASSRKREYFTNTVRPTMKEAEIAALHMAACWHRRQMDIVHSKLYEMDALEDGDEYGYLA